MGKSRRKKKKKSKVYTKSQFVEIICSHCALCGHKPNPLFCYAEAFKKDPKTFINVSYPRLIEFGIWLSGHPQHTVESSLHVDSFKRIFCRSGICGEEKTVCVEILTCYECFRMQFRDRKTRIMKKTNSKKPVVMKPYPTFFTSNNEEWKNLIKEILSNED